MRLLGRLAKRVSNRVNHIISQKIQKILFFFQKEAQLLFLFFLLRKSQTFNNWTVFFFWLFFSLWPKQRFGFRNPLRTNNIRFGRKAKGAILLAKMLFPTQFSLLFTFSIEKGYKQEKQIKASCSSSENCDSLCCKHNIYDKNLHEQVYQIPWIMDHYLIQHSLNHVYKIESFLS